MNLFGKKKNEEQNNAQGDTNLPQFCYRLAYFVLPQILFGDCERTIGYFTNPTMTPGAFLYLMGTKLLKVEPVREHALLFETHTGKLTNEISYYVLQYPTPPPVDLGAPDVILAPYFSAILRDSRSGSVRYFTLGQNPHNDTTLRCVFPDGANANLGSGPEPTLDNFLEAIRQLQAD